MEIDTDSISVKIDKINLSIQLILQRLDSIESTITKCEKSCDNMDMHIDFVNEAYSTLRNPLDSLKSHYNFFSGSADTHLPQIRDKI